MFFFATGNQNATRIMTKYQKSENFNTSRTNSCRKRSVRFADAMGLQLERVQYYVKDEYAHFDYESRLVSLRSLQYPPGPTVPPHTVTHSSCSTYPSYRSPASSPSVPPSSSLFAASQPVVQLYPSNFVYRTHNECASRCDVWRIAENKKLVKICAWDRFPRCSFFLKRG